MKLLDILNFAFRFICLLIKRPYTVAGRSWYCEIIYRAAKTILLLAEKNSISWLRQQELLFSKISHRGSPVSAENTVLAGHLCNLFSPSNTKDIQQMIIYFHGGGFVLNGGLFYNRFCCELAQKSQIPVTLFNYRLAPEHRYPTAHHDCLEMTYALLKRYPNTQFHFVGDSAGASLLLSTYQQLAVSHNAQHVKGITLISPWVSPKKIDQSIKNNDTSDCLSHRNLQVWCNAYYGQTDNMKPEQRILQFPFSISPPIFVQYSSTEIMAQQIKEFTDSGINNGASISVDKVNNLFHNFQIIGMYTREGQLAINKIVDFIKH